MTGIFIGKKRAEDAESQRDTNEPFFILSTARVSYGEAASTIKTVPGEVSRNDPSDFTEIARLLFRASP